MSKGPSKTKRAKMAARRGGVQESAEATAMFWRLARSVQETLDPAQLAWLRDIGAKLRASGHFAVDLGDGRLITPATILAIGGVQFPVGVWCDLASATVELELDIPGAKPDMSKLREALAEAGLELPAEAPAEVVSVEGHVVCGRCGEGMKPELLSEAGLCAVCAAMVGQDGAAEEGPSIADGSLGWCDCGDALGPDAVEGRCTTCAMLAPVTTQ